MGTGRLRGAEKTPAGRLLASVLAMLAFHLTAAGAFGQTAAGLRLKMPRRMVNDKTLTLKAELVDRNGAIDWRTWTAYGTVSARRLDDGRSVPLTVTFFESHAGFPAPDSIRFYNGVGSVSFYLGDGPCQAGGDIEVTVTVGGLSASKTVTVLAQPPELVLWGALSGDSLSWGPEDGVVHLIGDISWNSGDLTIAPGTLVMLDPGVDLLPSSTRSIQALGTEEDPILFFPTSGPEGMVLPNVCELCDGGWRTNRSSWGQIRHTGSGTSTYRHAFITGGGYGSSEGHTRPPLFRFADSTSFLIEDCVFVDNPGKAIYGVGSGNYTTNRTLFSRCGHGTEYTGGGAFRLRISNSWYTGIGRGPGTVSCGGPVLDCAFDGDLINPRGDTGDMVVDGCVLTDGGDEALDNAYGRVTVRNSIIYNVRDTGYTDDQGSAELFMENCLIFSNGRGVSGGKKHLTNCTLYGGGCVGAASGSTVDKCIIWPQSCSGCPAVFNYSLVGPGTTANCGVGNLSTDPQFVNSAGPQYDFSLKPTSPALTAGPDGERIGWLGFPSAGTCATSADCNDGNACTTDTCVNRLCEFASIPDCVPCSTDAQCGGDPTCRGVCTAGLCVFPGSACDDGLACTDGDACFEGRCTGQDACPPRQVCDPAHNQCETVPTTLIFQQGVNGYAGTADTQLEQQFPDEDFADLDQVEWDGQESTAPPGLGMIVALIRFDDIFGEGADRIPVGEQITSATLNYNILFNGGDEGEVREVLVDWSETVTWNGFGPTPGPNPEDYGPVIDTAPGFQTTIGGAALSLNVTDSIQRWAVDPAANRGWIFLPLGNDGSELQSSEYADDTTARPKLTVTFGGAATVTPFPNVTRPPYLQMGSPTSMTIVWQTVAAGNSRVVYGTDPANLGQTAINPASSKNHVVTITGLSPSTTYYYAVGSTADLYAGGCSEHHFRTSPPQGDPARFTAWMVGDSGGYTPMQFAVRDAMLWAAGSNPPSIFLHTGDLAHGNGTEAELTQNHFRAYPRLLSHTVFWPGIGNHDSYSSDSGGQSGPYFDAFALPRTGECGGTASGTEAYYSFDYANAHFICLDSDDSSRSPGSPMLTWLAADLAATTQQWVIAFWHHPAYSKGSHDSDVGSESGGRLVQMREYVAPILEAGGVDLVLAGHSHAYERSRLIDGVYGYGSAPDYATPSYATLLADGHILDAGDGNPNGDGAYVKSPGLHPHEGTVYATIGHGGKSLDLSTGAHPVMVRTEINYGSCLLTIDGQTLTLRNIRETGAQSDIFSIVKPCAPGTAQCDDGRYCNGDEICDGTGTCRHGTAPCAPSQVCNEASDTCETVGECTVDADCDDGNPCTHNLCTSHSCSFPDLPAGTGCGDPSDTACDNPDSCDGSGACRSNLEPAGTLCRPSAGTCDISEACTGVFPACPPDMFAVTGTTCRVSAGPCDLAEYCSGTSAYCPGDAHAPDGAPCPDEGNLCTDDTCASGACTHTNNARPCDDGNSCTTDDTCSNGVCLGGPQVPCDDENVCTDDWCDPLAGCRNGANTDSCEDGLFCTAGDRCASGICVGGPNPCTDACEQCDEDGATCAWCMFDLDGTGVVGGGDFALFSGCYGRCYRVGDPCMESNFDGDYNGCVGGGDFGVFSGCYAWDCGQCANCWGPRLTKDYVDAGRAAVAVVMVVRPTAEEVVTTLPQSVSSVTVGQTFYVEVWASGSREVGGQEKGLAAVYTDISYGSPWLVLEEVRSSGVLGLLTNGVQARAAVRGLGGCASLGQGSLGTGGRWVRVGTLRVHGQRAGQVVVETAPASGAYGIALFERFGELDRRQVDYGSRSVQIEGSKPRSDRRLTGE